MKRRSGFATYFSESGGLRIVPKTFLTCDGSGRTVIVVSYLSYQWLLVQIEAMITIVGE